MADIICEYLTYTMTLPVATARFLLQISVSLFSLGKLHEDIMLVLLRMLNNIIKSGL